MDQVGALLGGMALFGIAVDGVLRMTEKPSRKFPSCFTCNSRMKAIATPRLMPGVVSNHLGMHRLPNEVASLFVCPKGHYRLWYVPEFGTINKFFFREGL
jgi:hypothetical protein